MEDLDPKLKEEFFRSVYNTAQLIGLKELGSFRLGIDYEDANCQDLILKLKDKPDKEHIDIISRDGYSIIKRYHSCPNYVILTLNEVKGKNLTPSRFFGASRLRMTGK